MGTKQTWRRGQAMVEYVLAFVSLLVVVSVMTHFIIATKRHGVRTVRLVSSDYP